MLITTIPIEGTFDIARGRLSLRTHTAIHGWPPVFAARASAVLTAIGELIIASGANRVIPVKMGVVAESEDQGLTFELSLPAQDANSSQWETALARVDRAADSMSTRDIANNIEISTWIAA